MVPKDASTVDLATGGESDFVGMLLLIVPFWYVQNKEGRTAQVQVPDVMT